jgi:uncharacterized protein (TIGR02444 family)
MAVTFEDHPFWDYALEVYGRDGVSPALIALQDRHTLDVNMLLLSLWVSHSGRGVLNDDEIAHALQVSAHWNPEVVCGLRRVRILLRDEIPLVPRDLSDAVRKQLLALEIDCEHVEQLAMAKGLVQSEDASLTIQERFDHCVENFRNYFARLGCRLTGADRADLTKIFSAAFPEIAQQNIEEGSDTLIPSEGAC